MESIKDLREFLLSQRDRFKGDKKISMRLYDVKGDLFSKSSQWLKLRNTDGELRIYEEDVPTEFKDLRLDEAGKEVLITGACALIPVAGPWIVAGRIGWQAAQLLDIELKWKNTYIFLASSLRQESILAIEIHHPRDESISCFLEEIEDFFKDIDD